MLYNLFICMVLFCFGKSYGVIYKLNDTQYKQLPPLFELEDYESCMQSPGGVYCVANLELYTDSQKYLHTLIQEYSEHTVKHYNYSKIDRGVCVTRTCEYFARNAGLDVKRDPRSVLEGCLNETINKKYELSARIYNMNCENQTDVDHMNVDYVDYIVLAVFITLLVLTMIGSCCDVYSNKTNTEQNHTKGKEFLLYFSIFENLKKLTSEDMGDSRMDLFKGLHCIRTIAIALVVYGHVFTISGDFTSNPHIFEKAYDSLHQRIIFSISNVVQIFIFITGLFLTYFLQVSSETHNLTWKAIPMIVFQRWWRLTPAAAMLVAFMATWMRHLGHGPLWSMYVSNGPSQQCRRFFWAHVFYFNNYMSDDTSCALQTWYIATDMQLIILGLITHFIIKNRSANFKIITLLSLLLIGIISPALHVWFQDLDAFAMQTPESHRHLFSNVRVLHMFGHNNLPCFIIGMASGYWIYYLQQNKVDYSNYKTVRFLYWCVVPIYVVTIYCGSLFYYDGDRPSIAIRIAYAVTNKAIIGIANAFWIIGALYKFNGLTKAAIEWPGWVVASKLSYCVYLLHSVFILILLGVRTQLTPVSFLNTFFVFIGVLVITYVLALPFYLIVEAPTTRLLKLIGSRKIKRKLN